MREVINIGDLEELRMLKNLNNKCSLAKIGVDTAENELPKNTYISSPLPLIKTSLQWIEMKNDELSSAV